jgi:hypothetical protein
MAHDIIAVPRTDLVIEAPPMAEVPAAPLHVSPPTAEQVQATDKVFANASESRAALGLLGVWSSVMLLHDLAAEHLGRLTEEEMPRRKLPRPDDEPAE